LTADVTTPIEASFGGGNILTVSGNGFYDGDLKDINKVEVCGRGPEFECKV